MNNTTKTKENPEVKTEEAQETVLNLKLRTGLMHRNKFEEAQTRISYTSYYLSSIFFFVRVAVEAESLLEQQTESEAYTGAQFRENIQFLMEIGKGLSEWLPDYAYLLTEASRVVENQKKRGDK